MIPKLAEREQAIFLRRKGLSYREILGKVPVAKSTLSLWLRSVGLSQRQKQRITQKRLEAGRRGAQKRKEQRIAITQKIREKAKAEVRLLSRREFWLLGVALYWAEGCKEKVTKPGTRVDFCNSDPRMIKFFLAWSQKIFERPLSDIRLEIYIHENHKYRLDIVKEYWASQLNIPVSMLSKVYFKRHRIKTNRKNIGNNYFGLLRMKIRASSSLNRKIQGWVDGITHTL